MSTHPFGPIENHLVVGYYSRANSRRPDRARVRLQQPLVFTTPDPEIWPIFQAFKFEPLLERQPRCRKKVGISQARVRIFTGQLWNVMYNYQYGYRITLTKDKSQAALGNYLFWPGEATVEVLSSDNDVLHLWQVIPSNLYTKFGSWKHFELDKHFQDCHKLVISVTRECVAVWADGELRQQLTRHKPINHPERLALGIGSQLSDSYCFSHLTNDGQAEPFSWYLCPRINNLLRSIRESARPDKVQRLPRKLAELQQIVHSMFNLMIQPAESCKKMSIDALKLAVDVLDHQIQGVSAGDQPNLEHLESSVSLILMACKGLLYDSAIAREMTTRLSQLDPETVENEKVLYELRTPQFDCIFEELISNSKLLGPHISIISGLQPNYQQGPLTDTFVGTTKRYQFTITDSQMLVARKEPNRDQKKLESVFRISRVPGCWWDLCTVTVFWENDIFFMSDYDKAHFTIIDINASFDLIRPEENPLLNRPGLVHFFNILPENRKQIHVVTFDRGIMFAKIQDLKLQTAFFNYKEQPKIQDGSWLTMFSYLNCYAKYPPVIKQIVATKQGNMHYTAIYTWNQDEVDENRPSFDRIIILRNRLQSDQMDFVATNTVSELHPKLFRKPVISLIAEKSQLFVLVTNFKPNVNQLSLLLLRGRELVVVGKSSQHLRALKLPDNSTIAKNFIDHYTVGASDMILARTTHIKCSQTSAVHTLIAPFSVKF